MSSDQVLKPSCEACGAESDLYGTECKHTTLCTSCSKTMAENRRESRSSSANVETPSSNGQSTSDFRITEAEIRSAILEKAQTLQEIVRIFKPRIKSLQDKASFSYILRRISSKKEMNGRPIVVLKEKYLRQIDRLRRYERRMDVSVSHVTSLIKNLDACKL